MLLTSLTVCVCESVCLKALEQWLLPPRVELLAIATLLTPVDCHKTKLCFQSNKDNHKSLQPARLTVLTLRTQIATTACLCVYSRLLNNHNMFVSTLSTLGQINSCQLTQQLQRTRHKTGVLVFAYIR